MKLPVDIHNLKDEKTITLLRTRDALKGQLEDPLTRAWERSVIKMYLCDIDEELLRRSNNGK